MMGRARLQRNKAAKYTFFSIYPFRVSFSRNYYFYCKKRNSFSTFASVFESTELGVWKTQIANSE